MPPAIVLKQRGIMSLQYISSDGKSSIHRRQKLIKIADRSKDGWKVVEEYESDGLASNSEDEKRVKKAKEAASRKRRLSENAQGKERLKKLRMSSEPEQKLFRGKI